MWNLKKNDTNELIQNRNKLTDIKNKLMVTKGEKWGGINLKFGINRYTLLYIKQINNKDLKKNIYMYMCIYAYMCI